MRPDLSTHSHGACSAVVASAAALMAAVAAAVRHHRHHHNRVEQEGLKFAGMTVDGARLVKVQRLWRSKTTGPGGRRLHAKNLSERCMFEDKLVSGLFRMSLQLGIFVLLLVALGYTSKTAHKRGLYTNFRTYPRPRRLPRSPVPRSFAHSTRV